MEGHENQLKIEITQDKLVDLLLHAATREDIAKLDNKIDGLESKINSKIDALESKINSKIDALESKIREDTARLDGKIDALEPKINSKIDALESRIDRQFQKIDHRYNWIIGINLTVGVGVVGLLIKIISMIH